MEPVKTQLSSEQNLGQEITTLLEKAGKLRQSNPTQALTLCQQASDMAARGELNDQGLRLSLAQSFALLGSIHTQLANFDLATTYYFSALTVFEESDDESRSSQILGEIAAIYTRIGAYQEAIQYCLQELELVKKLGEKKMEVDLLGHIGLLESYWGDSTKALTYFQECLNNLEEMGDIEGQAHILDMSCIAYCSIKDYSRALQSGQKSLDLYQLIRSRKGEAEALNSLGEVFLAQQDYDQALTFFENSLQICEDIGLRYEEARIMLHVGSIFRQKGDLDQAISQYFRGMTLAEKINGKQLLVQYHQQLAETFKQLGEFENALQHYVMFHMQKEEVFKEASDGRLRNLEMTFQAKASQQESHLYQMKNIALQDENKERREIEVSLRNANDRLRKQILEHEQVISDLDAFSHMVAHDLKNPLQVVVFGSAILLDLLGDKIGEDNEVILQNILQMGQKMKAIIDELLVLASVRQQEVTLQPLDMPSLIESVKQRLAPLIDENKAVISEPESWPTALGHAPWIEEVWANYISNAIKYGGKPPLVELGSTLSGNGKIQFWVRDNGVGIKKESKEQLFTPFKRFNKIQATGHGLGLSIVKKIIEKLGGEVSANTEGLGKGSVFSFTLTDATPFINSQAEKTE